MTVRGRTLAAALLIPALAGCSEFLDSDCDDEISRYTGRYGPPEDIDRYRFDGYETVTYYWYDIGRSRDFTYGDDVAGCEVGRFDFTPIDDVDVPEGRTEAPR